MYRPWHFNILIRLSPENLNYEIKRIEQITRSFAPEYPFQFQFLDEIYNQVYADENRLGVLINIFTFIAIFISALGLFGLSSYLILQRTKEIGIRKVLGASSGSIVSLLSNEFSILLLLANFIAWPVAGYLIYSWLQNFAYHIDIQLWVFIVSGLLAFLVALITVGVQSLKAAVSNPVQALRYE